MMTEIFLLDEPPPYTPRDPHARAPSPAAPTSPSATPPPPAEEALPALRGGFLRRRRSQENGAAISPIDFFEERAYNPQNSLPLVVIDRPIHPGLTREEVELPLSEADCEARDLVDQDWATFVNFLVAELNRRQWASDGSKSEHWGKMTAEEFFECKLRIEPIVGEWNSLFFMPRGIHFNASFSYDAPDPAENRRAQELAGGLEQESNVLLPSHAGMPLPDRRHDMPRTDSRWAAQMIAAGLEDPRGRRDGSRNRRRSRSSSPSSGSSISSVSSVSSVSTDALSDVDFDQVRESIIQFKLDYTRNVNLKDARDQLHSAIKDSRDRGYRLSQKRSKEAKAEWKTKKVALRGELHQINGEIKNFNKELKSLRRVAKATRKADKKERKMSHRAAKAERKLDSKAKKLEAKSRDKAAFSGKAYLSAAPYDPSDAPIYNGPLTPPSENDMEHERDRALLSRDNSKDSIISAELRQRLHIASSNIDVSQLSKADRKSESQARHWDNHARHWSRMVSHWDKKWQPWVYADDRREETLAANEKRCDTALADQIYRCSTGTTSDGLGSRPLDVVRLEKLEEKRRKKAEKAETARAKRAAAREAVRSQLRKNAELHAKTMDDCVRKSRELQAKMHWQPEQQNPRNIPHSESSRAGAARSAGGIFDMLGQNAELWGEQLGRNVEAWGLSFGAEVEERGERLGRQMEESGNRFGKRVETWGSFSR